jgi:site-specific DNA-methyltransferase (adenine-specific)
VGFELSEHYAANIEKRLNRVNAGDPLSGAEEPKVSAPSTQRGKRLGAAGERIGNEA